MPGVVVSADDYGYADSLFVASVMREPDGSIGSVLLMTDEGRPSEEVLLAVKEQIEHYLENHLEK